MLTFQSYELTSEGVLTVISVDDQGVPHRQTRDPGADITDLPPATQTEIQAAWTPEVVQAYRDKWYPAPTLTDHQAEKLAALDVLYLQKWQTEFAYDFGTTDTKDDSQVDKGPAGPQTLQMRDTADHPDQRNWNAVATNATLALVGGAPTTVIPVKVTSNVWVQTTAQQLASLMPAMAQRQSQTLARYGALKAAITAAADQATLDAIDIATGWPV